MTSTSLKTAALPMTIVTPKLVAKLVCVGLLVAACGGGSSSYNFIEPAEIEPVEGSEVSRIILTLDANERLGVSTVAVRSESVARRRQFGVKVVDEPEGADGGAALWLRLVLTETERNSVDFDQGGVLTSLFGDSAADGELAKLVDGVGGTNGLIGDLFFQVAGGPELTVGTPLLIELRTASFERLVVPYGAVIYDPQGQTWTYTNPEPLVYQRAAISIDYIDGDDAILLDGPPPGTEVVVVGAAELSGFEAGIGR